MSVDKLVDSTQLDADLTSVANAIRTKGGTSASLAFPADFVSAIAAIPSGGESQLTGYIASGIYPNGDYDIQNITSLAQAFTNTQGTITLNFPDVTTTRRAYAFENTTATKISLPKVTNIYPYCLTGSTSILSFFAPLAQLQAGGGQSYNRYFFNNCANLQTVVIGRLGSGYQQFQNCGSLKTVDILSSADRIDNSFQNGDSNFDTLILRGDSIIQLYTVTAFDSTKFKNGGAGGTIYIPQALYDHLGDGTSNDYKAATNWSTVNGYGTITWAKIEGSYYETHYADGTLIS